MNHLPKDPVMLLSYVNTQLRDFYPSLSELCASLDVEQADVESALGAIGYVYAAEKNRFE